jgi:hypothetical protein
MRRFALSVFLVATLIAVPSARGADLRATLRGSRTSMERQNEHARKNDLKFARTRHDIGEAITEGHLVAVPGNDDYDVIAAYPVALAETRLFVERLAAQYRTACGEKLVVTSLARPLDRQPSNASPLSVHPAGMAVDLRVSARSSCQNWLRQALVGLESRGVIDATEEFRPPHFHVALFPGPYLEHVDRLLADSAAAAAASASPPLQQDSVAAIPAEGAQPASQGTDAGETTAQLTPQTPSGSWLGRIWRSLAIFFRS